VVKKSSQKKHDVEVAQKTKGPKKPGPKKSVAKVKRMNQKKHDISTGPLF
jgi:hypothetical protein